MRNISTRARGTAAETAAVNYLLAKGYEISQRNFYCRYGELDIIARDQGMLVFVEVKSIVVNPEVQPWELLAPHKLRRIQRSIDYWLALHASLDVTWRFDFIAVVLDADYQVKAIEHIPEPEL